MKCLKEKCEFYEKTKDRQFYCGLVEKYFPSWVEGCVIDTEIDCLKSRVEFLEFIKLELWLTEKEDKNEVF